MAYLMNCWVIILVEILFPDDLVEVWWFRAINP